jgi:hypothetical protein
MNRLRLSLSRCCVHIDVEPEQVFVLGQHRDAIPAGEECVGREGNVYS